MSMKVNELPLASSLQSHRLSAKLLVSETISRLNGRDLTSVLRRAVKLSGLKAIRSTQANFEPHGASAVVLLKESHVAIHLWPEFKVITIDIHVCDYTSDNLSKAWRLAQVLTELTGFPFNQEDWIYIKIN
jgi:S-adenosylmethionine decarboxylase